MYQPRIPITFANQAGSEDFDFPLAEFSFEWEQDLRTAFASQVGAHGEFDLLRDGTAVKGAGLLRLSFTAFAEHPKTVEATIDEMQKKLFNYGRGKLWTSGLDSSAAEELRWTYARAVAMPQLSWAGGDVTSKRASIGFRCDPFWYDDTALSGSPFTLNSDPDTFEITNPGNAPIFNALLTLAGTYTNPVIRNTTNGYQVESTTDGSSAAHLLQFNAGTGAIRKSTDTGAAWTNDYANYVRQTGQVQLMRLEPGVNAFTVTGCSSGTLAIVGYGAFH